MSALCKHCIVGFIIIIIVIIVIIIIISCV